MCRLLSVLVSSEFSERNTFTLQGRHLVKHCLAKIWARKRKVLWLLPQRAHSLEGGGKPNSLCQTGTPPPTSDRFPCQGPRAASKCLWASFQISFSNLPCSCPTLPPAQNNFSSYFPEKTEAFKHGLPQCPAQPPKLTCLSKVLPSFHLVLTGD